MERMYSVWQKNFLTKIPKPLQIITDRDGQLVPMVKPRLYNKKCEERGSKVIGMKDNATFLT